MPRRATDPDSPGVAAWGDPAVVARCGVAALGPTEVECLEVDGVGWIPEPLSDGTRFTSFGTTRRSRCSCRAAYAPEGLLLPAFAPVVEGAARQRSRLPLTPDAATDRRPAAVSAGRCAARARARRARR